MYIFKVDRLYYNGAVCIPYEKDKLRPNQKVIITALDELTEPKHRKLGSLKGKARVIISEDREISGEEMYSNHLASCV